MKKFTTLIAVLFCAVALFAQAPEKFTYQAVVRNATNNLIINAQVGVRVNILQGTASGTTVYSESHIASTNTNGLVTVNIGGGSVLHGSFSGIDWSDGPYFLKTDIDPNGGNDYTITSVQQLLSVPYALYAKEAANAFSGDYNDLTNAPQLPTVPTTVSAFTNDANYITLGDVPAQVNADWNATTGAAEILNKPNLFSGNYNDLTNKPTIPTVPTNVSAFTNDANYITLGDVPAQVNADWNATTGAAEILNKPAIPTVPTNVSAFTNDAGYITSAAIPAIPTVPTNVSAFSNDAGYLTGYTETDPQFNAWDKDYNDLTNKPAIPTVPTNVSAFTNDAGYITMDSVPAIPTNVSAFTNDAGYLTGYTESDPQFNAWDKDYNDLINKPVLFDGNYNSLTNKPDIPTVPTNVSAFNNDAGYLTSFTEQQVLSISHDTLFLTGGSFVKLPAGFDGDYNSLTNKPAIPTVPTNVSAFTNDAGYITNSDIPAIPTVPTNVSAFNNDAGYLTNYTETDPQFNAWDKNYNDLTNKPTIPIVPTNVSAFTNDAGYLTSFTEQQVLSISHDTLFLTGGSFVKLPAGFDGDYNSLTNKPTIPTVPTNVSAFTNDAGYITNSDIPAIPTVPTNVSAFTNDAGYITAANVQEAANIPTNVSAFNNDAGYLTSYTETDPQFNAWDKDYNDLTNKPTIPTVPTNVSAFTNDAGYLTSFTEQQVLSISHDTLFLTGGSFVKLPAGFDGDYNSLTNKPAIPTVPTNVSAFTNDAGYITNNDIPAIPTVPTNVSQLNNDAGYITAAQCGDVDICALANQLAQLQQQMAQMQARLDSLEGNTTFTCGTSTVTDHEGNVYHTLQIGNQCWMRDNLRTTTSPSTGTYLIPATTAGYTWTGKQARWYNNDSATYAVMNYGLLYNWNAAMDTFNTAYGETSVNTSTYNAVSVTFNGHRRGICPVGWHLPSDAEWTAMTDYVSGQSEYVCGGNTSYIAKALADSVGWSSHTNACVVGNDQSANNATGFSAVPAGHCSGSSFDYAGGKRTYFWSSSQHENYQYYAWYRNLSYDDAGVYSYYNYKYYGRSVRCLRD